MYRMLNKRTQYKPLRVIARGGTCKVVKCRNLQRGKTLAMKRIWIDSAKGVPSMVIREVSVLKELQHRNIVRLLDVLSSNNRIDLVVELLDCNLMDLIRTQPMFPRKAHQTKKYLYQILDGLAYCHAHSVIHRDLKPENLLIDRYNDIVKLADFGLAKAVGDSQKHHSKGVGSYSYTAPEILLNDSQYSTSADIWSAGCIFAEMLTSRVLFPGGGTNALSHLYAIFSIRGLPDPEMKRHGYGQLPYEELARVYSPEPKDLTKVVPGLEPAGIDLLSRMLCFDPEKRIKAQEALEHHYFKDVGNKTCMLQLWDSVLALINNLKSSIF